MRCRLLRRQAGYWDGSVAVWRLAAARSGVDAAAQRAPEQAVRLELLLHMPALDGPVRGLAWAPREVATAAGDLAHRNLFVTAGHSSKLRFWDARHDLPGCGIPDRNLNLWFPGRWCCHHCMRLPSKWAFVSKAL